MRRPTLRALFFCFTLTACVIPSTPDGGAVPPPDGGGMSPDGGTLPGPDGGMLVAHCPGQSFKSTVVTYFGPMDLPANTEDPRCTRVMAGGNSMCRIALHGVLHQPASIQPGTKLPTLIFNHGSEVNIDVQTAYCNFADLYVPAGYQVFAPFRRGHGEACPLTTDVCPGMSSGLNEGDEAQLCTMMPSLAYCPASCSGKGPGCYLAETFEQQISDIAAAVAFVKALPETDLTKIAIVGYSFGGIMTVASNSRNLGQQCAAPMAPGSLSYANPFLRTKMIDFAAKATAPAYYLDAEFDRHNVEVPELAWAHSRREGMDGGPGLADDDHGEPVQWAIFTFKDPPPNPDGGPGLDYQSIHTGFFASRLWAPSLTDFLERYNVKP